MTQSLDSPKTKSLWKLCREKTSISEETCDEAAQGCSQQNKGIDVNDWMGPGIHQITKEMFYLCLSVSLSLCLYVSQSLCLHVSLLLYLLVFVSLSLIHKNASWSTRKTLFHPIFAPLSYLQFFVTPSIKTGRLTWNQLRVNPTSKPEATEQLKQDSQVA